MATKRDRSYKGAEPDMVRARQSAFLAAYGEVGSVRAACEASKVGRSTVNDWIRYDAENFRAKFSVAKEIFRESLQDLAVDRVKHQKPNDNPVLLITLLNAHWSELYRRDGAAASNDVREMMAEWKRFVKDNNRKHKSVQEKEKMDEGDVAALNAINEVEKIMSRRRRADDNSDS